MKKKILSIATCLALGGFANAQVSYQLSSAIFDAVTFSSIAFADVDNDGDQDVLITGLSSSGNISKLYTNDGSGSFTEVTGTPFDGVSYPSIAFADVDNDGDQDVLITGSSTSGLISELYTNDGSGSFTEVTGTPFDGVEDSSIAFADVDNDGDQDVLITGVNSSWQAIAKLYTNNGSGSFTEVTGTPFDGVSTSSIAFADVDNDGDKDVLITGSSSSGNISKLYTNNGAGSFTEVAGTSFDGVYLSSIAFTDVDNDGDQDVLITGSSTSGLISKLYTNDGSGSFTEVTGTPFDGVSTSSIAFADVDNDGDKDVLITGQNSSTKISKLYTNNNGSGVFTEVTGTPFDGVYRSSIAFADIDNDGDKDVLITGQNSSGNLTSKLYTVCVHTTGAENYTGCQGDGYSVTINGTNYNETNPTGTETLTNAAGCDSVVTINLVFNAPNTGDTTATACNSFTWYGNTYTTSGTPTHTLTNVAGCDSVVTLNLTINSVNVATSVSGETITADLTGAAYQWINCSDNSVIAGETAQSFTATANGDYAVIVTDGSCSDTSACVTINSVSIEENNISFSIHPNPTNGEVNIVSDFAVSKIEIFSATGRKVMESKATTLNISKVKSGAYFVKVHTEQGTFTQRIIKE